MLWLKNRLAALFQKRCHNCNRARAGFLDLGAPWSSGKFTCYGCMKPETAAFLKVIGQ